MVAVQPVWADVSAIERNENPERNQAQEQSIINIPQLSEMEQPAKTLQEWRLQITQASIVQVTEVRLNSTNAGLEIILITSDGQLSVPASSVVGKALIADISSAVLALPDGNEFIATEPADGIALVSVTSLPENRVRVAITGIEAPPTAQVRTAARGLVLSVVPGVAGAAASEDDSIEIVVTAEQNDDYFVPNASTATRTDTPILEIPQSIQVIPRQVLEDRQVTRLDQALQDATSVTFGGTAEGRGLEFNIRGFEDAPVLRNGFRIFGLGEGVVGLPEGLLETSNLERIEVLRGPASILYGQIEPGGAIGLVTEQPLAQPFYEVGLQLGTYGLIRPTIDLSGPLTPDRRLRYRFNGVYQREDSFRNLDVLTERVFIAPVLTWEVSDRTDLTLSLEYSNDSRPVDAGLVAFGNGVIDVPRDRISNEPDDFTDEEYLNLGYSLEHRFSDRWRIRNALRYIQTDLLTEQAVVTGPFDEETGILNRNYGRQKIPSTNLSLQTDVVGKFATGSIEHTLLFGVDLNWANTELITNLDFTSLPLNLFDPDYGAARPDFDAQPLVFNNRTESDRLGVFLQDQIALLDNLILVAGIRYDSVEQRRKNNPTAFEPSTSETSQTDNAWSPRLGIVYQPLDNLSLFASYSRSFTPNQGTTAENGFLEPKEAEGFETGIKLELLEGRLLTTLAYFDTTQRNIATEDLNFPGLGFVVASGEQRSRGVEFDISGEVLPGWNILAGYAYTDAEITDDNVFPVGNQLPGTPRHRASLWTTYEIQQGDLQGLGFGLGLNFVGERQGDLDNSFQLDSYFLTKVAIFYRRDNWRLALHINNLFDVNYIEGIPNSRLSGIVPGKPLTVVGSIVVNF